MSTLAVLQELQTAYNSLRTVERELSTFPPDMARLESSAKVAGKRVEELSKKIDQAKMQIATLTAEHLQAIKAEEHARKDLKASAHKAQYTIAMRALDEKERQLELSQRGLKEAETELQTAEVEKEKQASIQIEDMRQFDELHEIFLAEHENQVVAKERLSKQIEELTGQLDEATLNKFNRLMQGRAGKAVVAMENNVCTGCNTKLRTPLVYQLKAQGFITCESCQRILYIPK
ncbi:MAG: C4-type zinc ribbon domain-containing protein [Holophagaceae bacterium]|nr:C4-type zinc ribbon domain-containing protein [Holophagaceae bacterium]